LHSAGKTDEDFKKDYLWCKEAWIKKLYSSDSDRDAKEIEFRTWSKSASNTDGHIIAWDGSDMPPAISDGDYPEMTTA